MSSEDNTGTGSNGSGQGGEPRGPLNPRIAASRVSRAGAGASRGGGNSHADFAARQDSNNENSSGNDGSNTSRGNHVATEGFGAHFRVGFAGRGGVRHPIAGHPVPLDPNDNESNQSRPFPKDKDESDGGADEERGRPQVGGGSGEEPKGESRTEDIVFPEKNDFGGDRQVHKGPE